MFTRIKRAILNRLTTLLREYNHIYTTDQATIAKDVILKGAQIFGNVELHERVKITNGAMINGVSKISIGRYSNISGPNTDITANIHPVIIGSFTSIARNVTIQETNHNMNKAATFNIHFNVIDGSWAKDTVSKGPIEIGNDVWIGTHSVILSGVKIGHGAIIAANSVVTADVPSYAVVGGTPAKVISYRFEPEVIDAMLRLSWWNWPIEKIKHNRSFFSDPVTLDSIRSINDSPK